MMSLMSRCASSFWLRLRLNQWRMACETNDFSCWKNCIADGIDDYDVRPQQTHEETRLRERDHHAGEPVEAVEEEHPRAEHQRNQLEALTKHLPAGIRPE